MSVEAQRLVSTANRAAGVLSSARHGSGFAGPSAWLPRGGAPKALRRWSVYPRFFISIMRRIIGVKMSCIARPILPPGIAIVFGRVIIESCSIDSR